MDHTKEWYEEAAEAENQHVRAVILKKDHPEHERAFELANRACEMAKRSLGEQHPAYAVALQNMGLCLCVIEKDAISGGDYFDWAREAADNNNASLAEGFYWLGVFYYESHDATRAADFFEQALEIQRRHLPPTSPEIAQSLIGLGYAKSLTVGASAAVPLLQEALAIQEAVLGVGCEDVRDTRGRLEVMRHKAKLESQQD